MAEQMPGITDVAYDAVKGHNRTVLGNGHELLRFVSPGSSTTPETREPKPGRPETDADDPC